MKRLGPLGARLGVRLAAVAVTAMAGGAVAAGTAGAAVLTSHGQRLHLAPGVHANATDSSNWFGYDQGALEQGGTLFHSISGTWTVPTATQHTSGQSEASSDWIGIGGGCVDSGCSLTDSTLIQTGTEQDVSSTGAGSYSAWYELVPAPSLTISSITVHPGDQMHADISQVATGVDVWKITLQDLTTGQSYSTTLPYPSTMASAEWIEETPLEIGTSPGFASLPNLTKIPFSSGAVNGSAVKLKTSEEMDLTDSNGSVIGAPSAPNSAGSGFDACAWASSCN